MPPRKGNHDAKAKPADKAPEKEEAGKPRESSGNAGIVQEPPAEPVAGRSLGGDGGGDAGQPVQRAPADEVVEPGESRQSSGSAGVVQEPPAEPGQEFDDQRQELDALLSKRDAWLEALFEGEDDFSERYPLLADAVTNSWMKNASSEPGQVRITAKRDGFRRCGVAHSKTPSTYEGMRFTPEELERLFAEPNLVVELI